MLRPSASDASIGLEYGHLEFVRVPAAWLTIGADLADLVATHLGDLVHRVEHIGSTAVEGMVAKPILDLTIGLRCDTDPLAVEQRLTNVDWIYRGDVGDSGGYLYVLESRPAVRVAHAHGVRYGGPQWVRYLRFRDRLRADVQARESYSNVKLGLLAELRGDDIRRIYTERKTPVISEILDSS